MAEDYRRLQNSKLPIVNLTKSTYERMLLTLDEEGVGKFMNFIHRFIYMGADTNFKDKVVQSLWIDTLRQINKSADWWFKKKETTSKLNITEGEINDIFKDGKYIGRIDNGKVG